MVLSIVQCTIVDNSATAYGGGIELTGSNDLNIKNTILAANTAPGGCVVGSL